MEEGKVLSDHPKHVQISEAKAALQLGIEYKNPLNEVEDDIRHLFRMWKQLSDTWQAINDMRALPWASVNFKNVRSSLESALDELSGKR